MEIIKLENSSIIKDGIKVLKEITTSIIKGKTTMVVGPSGCGKSIFLKAAAGIVPMDIGNLYINGEKFVKLDEKAILEFRKKSSFVFQDGALWENQSVKENLLLPLKFHFKELSNDEMNKKVKNILDRIGFWDNPDLRPAQLSTGERKMASFARAVITNPEILFLDNPTMSLDHSVADKIINIIKEMKKENKTLILTSHDPELISQITDFLIILDEGNLLASGPFSEIINSTDIKISDILSKVIDKPAAFDSDILDLLNP